VGEPPYEATARPSLWLVTAREEHD